MRYSSIVVLALSAMATAQSRDDIPGCALPCLDDAVRQTSSCATDDFVCICKNFDSIQGAATGCILKACGQEVALNQVLPATQEVCKKAEAGAGSSSSASAAPGSSQQSGKTVNPSGSVRPSATVAPAGTVAPSPGQTTHAITSAGSVTASTTPPPAVTAGAAGFAPVGPLAMLALGALVL